MSFSRTVEVVVRKDLDPAAAARDFAQRARAGIEAEIAAGNFPRDHRVFVDGRQGVPEGAVKPGGVIVYEGSYSAEVVTFGLAFLRARSPRGKSGDGKAYRDSFYVAINGRYYPPGEFDPDDVPEGAEIVIGNTRPYSRKVDVQQIGLRRLKFSTAPNLFADAAKAINQQFGNFVSAKRVYSMEFPGQYRLRHPQFRSDRGNRSIKRKAGTLVESPAIVIKPR